MAEQKTDYAVEVPHLGALILTHEWDGHLPGLKQFARADQPFSPLVFWSFRLMVALGMLMLAVGLTSLWLRWRGRLYETRWLQRVVIGMGPSGFVALLAGWTTTEAGRQPYTVYGMLRTIDSASPIGTPGLVASIIGFGLVYLIVFGAGLVFLLRMMAKPPLPGEPGVSPNQPIRSAGLAPAPAMNAAPLP
jgi:cytochrome d ubiquinol oxidase subunit I